MNQRDISKVARRILMGNKKKELIRSVYNEERREGLRLLARYMSEIDRNRYKVRDLMILAGLYTRKESTTEDNAYTGGKQGKLGGKQDLKTAQAFQSIM